MPKWCAPFITIYKMMYLGMSEKSFLDTECQQNQFGSNDKRL